MFPTDLPVAIGSDHAGFECKEAVRKYLDDKGIEYKDFGTYSNNSVDYPDFAHPVSAEVESGKASFGILICGSGNGVAMSANKHQKIRAALCWTEEIARLGRQHNNANIICIPGRFVSTGLAEKMIETFMATDFEGGRHARRTGKISC